VEPSRSVLLFYTERKDYCGITQNVTGYATYVLKTYLDPHHDLFFQSHSTELGNSVELVLNMEPVITRFIPSKFHKSRDSNILCFGKRSDGQNTAAITQSLHIFTFRSFSLVFIERICSCLDFVYMSVLLT
jgi:hypothetical protein